MQRFGNPEVNWSRCFSENAFRHVRSDLGMNLKYGFHGNSFFWRYGVGEMARQGAIGVEDLIRNKMRRMRHWKLTSLGKKRPKWGFEFTVMTYNILSQSAVDTHLYLYQKCNPLYLSEEYRISKILPEILKSNSDVVCLQEVEQYLYDQRIRHVFNSNGFESIFKKRTGNKSDGCAILWRRAKFNLLGHREVEYMSKGCEYLNRDNVALIAVLRPCHPKASQTQLHVATTHLVYNPRRGDVKLCQLRLLLAELEKSAFRGIGESGRLYHPTILCGDFNFEPHSPLYSFVESGRLDVNGLIAGNMSGQPEGKNKGGGLDSEKLALYGVGVDDSGRFSAGESSSNSQDRNSDKHRRETNFGNNSESYRIGHVLNSTMYSTQQSKDSTSADGAASSNSDTSRLFHTINRTMHSSQQQRSRNNACADRASSSSDGDISPSTSESSTDSTDQPGIFYHDFNFIPVYKYYNNRDRKSTPVTSFTHAGHTVDHMFYNVLQKNSSFSFLEDRLKLLGFYTLPLAENLKDDGLPNAYLGSDHLSLMSKFIIGFKH